MVDGFLSLSELNNLSNVSSEEVSELNLRLVPMGRSLVEYSLINTNEEGEMPNT